VLSYSDSGENDVTRLNADGTTSTGWLTFGFSAGGTLVADAAFSSEWGFTPDGTPIDDSSSDSDLTGEIDWQATLVEGGVDGYRYLDSGSTSHEEWRNGAEAPMMGGLGPIKTILEIGGKASGNKVIKEILGGYAKGVDIAIGGLGKIDDGQYALYKSSRKEIKRLDDPEFNDLQNVYPTHAKKYEIRFQLEKIKEVLGK